MACEILNGITSVCGYSASGIEKLWLANKSSLTGATTYDACGEITGMTWSAGTVTLYEIQAAIDTISYTDDLQINGSRRNFLQTINFSVGSIDCTIIGTLEDIGLANMIAIVKLSDGTFRAFGVNGTGLRATVLTDVSGLASDNAGNVSVTLSGTNLAKAPIIDTTYVATLGLS